MKNLYYITFVFILETVLFTTTALAGGDIPTKLRRLLRGKQPEVVHIETFAERLTRFQDQLTNALELQPHQECVLHHALLDQTEPLLPNEVRPDRTMTEAISHALRPDQQDLLLELLDRKPAIADEMEALSIRY